MNDRNEQAAAIARARANPLRHLPLSAQDAVSLARHLHGERAGNRLAKAFSALPERGRHVSAAEALRQAEQREQAELDDFLSWQADNAEPLAFGEY